MQMGLASYTLTVPRLTADSQDIEETDTEQSHMENLIFPAWQIYRGSTTNPVVF
jgi:hypothetical protein